MSEKRQQQQQLRYKITPLSQYFVVKHTWRDTIYISYICRKKREEMDCESDESDRWEDFFGKPKCRSISQIKKTDFFNQVHV